MAEDKGYLATIEKQVLAGQGSVDVALEREGKSIACEISVTTTVEHEIGNIQKCLAAGFEHVVLIASDKKTLTSARQVSSTAIAEKDLGRVKFMMPEELADFLEELEAEAATNEQVIRGLFMDSRHRGFLRFSVY